MPKATSTLGKPKATPLHDQLTTLRNELELSTFLNKGVLQSNSEHKLRIAELEAENAVLRKAESQLASTEDALEASEAQVKALKEDLKVADSLCGALVTREQDARAKAEETGRHWRQMYKDLLAASSQAQRLLGAAIHPDAGTPPGAGEATATTAAVATATATMARKIRTKPTPAASSSKAALPAVSSSRPPSSPSRTQVPATSSRTAAPRQPEASPLLRTSSLTARKRRRLFFSDDDDDDDEYNDDDNEEADGEPAPSPARRAPRRPPTPKLAPTAQAGRRKSAVKEKPARGRRAAAAQALVYDDDVEVKSEPESDLDPLAM